MAKKLSHPTDVLRESITPVDESPIEDAYTIPGGHISPQKLPGNTTELPWRSWRSKFTTIAGLYVLAARKHAYRTRPEKSIDERTIDKLSRLAADRVYLKDKEAVKREARSNGWDFLEDVAEHADTKKWTNLIKEALNTTPTKKTRAIHAVFSPPKDKINSHQAVTEWREKAVTVAKSAGIRGGMAIFHGFRVRDDVIAKFKTLLSQTEYDATATDVLQWEWLRRADWRELVEWGPHIHIVGLCDMLESHRGPGVLHKLRTFGEYTDENNAKTIAEHRAVAKDMIDHLTFRADNPSPAITWFGTLKGDHSWSAAEPIDSESLNQIRERLINNPANPN